MPLSAFASTARVPKATPWASNYNGRLRPKELLLCVDGMVELIRRAETVADHFAILEFDAKVLELANIRGGALIN